MPFTEFYRNRCLVVIVWYCVHKFEIHLFFIVLFFYRAYRDKQSKATGYMFRLVMITD